jgi:hypothetical protein
MHLKCEKLLSGDWPDTPQCPGRGQYTFRPARLRRLCLSRWSSLSSRQGLWVCAYRRFGTVCRRCSAEHSPFSHSLFQVSPLYTYICASKVVCSVPFRIRLLFLPLFVYPLYRHSHRPGLRYQDNLVGRTPRHFVAPLCIFSLVRLRFFSWIKIFVFSSASCFQTPLIYYIILYCYVVIFYFIILMYCNRVSTRWQRSVNLYKNRKETAIYKGRNSSQNNTKTQNTQNGKQNTIQ